jgi:protein O-GlcNAc transferase
MPTVSTQQAFALARRHYQSGRLADAEVIAGQILAAEPRHARAMHLSGVIAHQLGRKDAAMDLIRRAIALAPGVADFHCHLGIVCFTAGQWEEAVAALRQAIALQPGLAVAYCNLGNVLREMGQLDEAIAAYRQAVALNPNYPGAHSNLGVALKEKGQLAEAIAAYRRAIDENPNLPEAYCNLGNALCENGQPDEAIVALRQAIALSPSFALAHNNLGNALKDEGLLDEAIAAYRQAVALDASYPEAHSNLLYTLHFHPDFDARAIAEEHRSWNRQHAEPLRHVIRSHRNDRAPERRLRIGYVSPNLREHPVGRFLLPLLANHDQRSVEIFCYAQVKKPDALTDQLRTHTDHWHSTTGRSDDQVAEQIRQDEIDILVDLSLHMDRNRLLVFARKPAPIQVTYLAYAGTSGLGTMDYRLSDPYLDPPGMDESVYSEQTVRLRQTYWCYQPMGTPPAGPVPALRAGRITFGCLNNFCKVTERTLASWARILQAVPDAQLLLHAAEGSHRQRTARLLEQLGVDPRRLRFVAHVPMSEYLEFYQQIDIALDPFPYSGGTTSCDAFWMGVPVISLRGETAVGRAGVSLAMNLELPELIAPTPEAYVQTACNLAADLPRLSALRSSLRNRMAASPLMDAPRFARNIELAYREMWHRWCDGAGQ